MTPSVTTALATYGVALLSARNNCCGAEESGTAAL